MTVIVVAHLKARPETIDATRELLTSLILPTRIEEGCVTYELYQNEADPTDFTFIEEWTSDEDLDAHLESDHLKGSAAEGANLYAAPPDIRRYKLVA
ncbi:MAG: antibiotic biosynthesis monooxygenase [Acidobacteria bacterium]|nr:MAG: antibiotic biosynthesis monooxygenase [Acidobacteriota bacterium]